MLRRKFELQWAPPRAQCYRRQVPEVPTRASIGSPRRFSQACALSDRRRVGAEISGVMLRTLALMPTGRPPHTQRGNI